MSDNYRFDLACVPLETCLKVVADQYSRVVGWAELPAGPDKGIGGEWGANQAKKRLVFFWTKCSIPEFHPFPAPMEITEMVGE